MIVTAPRLEVTDARSTLHARFEFDDGDREPFEAWMAVPSDYADSVDRSATPFVPIATQVAGHIGEDLRFEAPASPRLVAAATTASQLFGEWWGYRPVRIEAPVPSTLAEAGAGVGIFYSRGTDTGATLVRSLTGAIPERVTHLLSGFDIEWAFATEVQHQIWAGHEAVANELGLPLVRLESNAKELLRGLIGWPRAFGTAYISPALMLGPLLGQIVTGSTQPVIGAEPRGSRYDLDPLWSTEGTCVRQDAYELDRLRRIGIVATHPLILRSLKVCWMGREAGNCGRCGKCLRTMTALAWHRVDPEDWPTFDGVLTGEAVLATKTEPGAASQLAWTAGLPTELADVRDAWEVKRRQTAELDAAAAQERERAARRRARRRRLMRKVRRRLGSA